MPDLLRDLNKQKFELRKSLAPATVLDGIQLVCGDSSNMEKKVQTMRAGWASDPVHPNGHIYAKIALNLIEKVAGATGPQATTGRKRSWSSSNRDEQSPATTNKHRQGDRFAGGGGSGGGSGGSDSGGGSGGSDSGRSGYPDVGNRGPGGNAGHTTGRSAVWKARGGNSGY